MKYRPRTSPGFYYRKDPNDGKRDIVRIDVLHPPREGEPSNPGTWWVCFIGTQQDYDRDGPSEYVTSAYWEMRLCEFSTWRRWPKDKPLPLKWQAFFDRNPA
jgi:hypothetical protein